MEQEIEREIEVHKIRKRVDTREKKGFINIYEKTKEERKVPKTGVQNNGEK